MLRRNFLAGLAAAPLFGAPLTRKQRVDRALKGAEVDRSPFSIWHHFHSEKWPAERFAKATLEFHRKFRTDLVKVMSDYEFPKPAGKWYELTVNTNPYPEQLRALAMIRQSLGGGAHFVETIFNPYNVAEKMSSKEEVERLRGENPKALLAALEAIAESEAAHARKALGAGASGIFLAIANAQDGYMTEADYTKFSEPFDRLVLDAVSGAPLNTLHLHGDKVWLKRFTGWPAGVVNYSSIGTGVGIGEFRAQYPGVIMGGLDDVKFRTLTPAEMEEQWKTARQAAGPKFILAPGCSIPNDTTDAEALKLVKLLKA